jgi:hypothetical protein
MDHVREVSDDVMVIAQFLYGATDDEIAHSRLIDAGLLLRELAGLPPPWDDPVNNARCEHLLREMRRTMPAREA